MSNQDSWHSQDAFWELFEPILFNQQRLSSTPEEVDKIVKLLQIEGQGKILDLSCGRGRHSLEFSRRAFDVIGVDRTAAYLEKARLEAEKFNLNATFVATSKGATHLNPVVGWQNTDVRGKGVLS